MAKTYGDRKIVAKLAGSRSAAKKGKTSARPHLALLPSSVTEPTLSGLDGGPVPRSFPPAIDQHRIHDMPERMQRAWYVRRF